MLTEADLREALRACFDPATGRDVIEAGMVCRLSITPDEEAPGAGIAGVAMPQQVRLVLRGKDEEDWRAMLVAQICNRLAGVQGISQVEIVWEAGLFRILA